MKKQKPKQEWEEQMEAEHKRTGGYFKYWLMPFISHSIQIAVEEERERVIKQIESIVIDGGSVTFNLKVWDRIKVLLDIPPKSHD